ncbi:hypothetical protein GUJ93_ZPchr0012g19112 [Zizania palustris]|uniref:Uncharacterized protein n=1 Tax=Zizania palustris TaxID=103762 RepID=A0A8J6BU25_ZIZPA|nr:hypothetical protein GUJ93_ZPchr0012g19112 [Zizania palustris]
METLALPSFLGANMTNPMAAEEWSEMAQMSSTSMTADHRDETHHLGLLQWPLHHPSRGASCTSPPSADATPHGSGWTDLASGVLRAWGGREKGGMAQRRGCVRQ